MKKALLILLLLFVTNFTYAQTQSTIVVRLDSTRISSFSLKSQGNINIFQTGRIITGRINAVLIQGKRPLLSLSYNSIADFNKSDFTSQLRNVAHEGGRLMIEYSPSSGSTMYYNMPIVE